MIPGASDDNSQSVDAAPGLTILDDDRRRNVSRRSTTASLARCSLVIAIAMAIRLGSAGSSIERLNTEETNVSVTDVKPWFPNAEGVDNSANGIASIVDSLGDSIGFAVTSLPAAKSVVGYRGPSNALLILDSESKVIGAKLLDSDDTPEHVVEVKQDATFFTQFNGWTLGDPSTHTSVDSVSGATLTSLALAEGIAVRLGGEKPSLRFPDDFNANDLNTLRITDEQLRLQSLSNFEATVGNGVKQNTLIRTGPLVDSIAGYQGPSEVLLLIDSSDNVTRAALRRTFDNQPYASYLNEDTYFWKIFCNKSIRQISAIDLEAEQVEGVSGATMTSLAVADTIVAAAKEFEIRKRQANVQPGRRAIRWGWHDVGTLLVLVMGSVIALTRLRGVRWLRYVWNLILVVYLGLVTGNLISLAVVLGWAASGVAWKLAPGLAAIVVVSFVLSTLTRRNIYCSHICPHGAAQQLLRRRSRLPQRTRKLLNKLRWIPGSLLLVAVLVTVLRLNLNLAAWEPFNAYIWYVAGASSITLAIGSLIFSWFVPMGYCRYACGTGRLLDYVRRTAQSDRITIADTAAVLVAIGAWCRVFA